MSAGRRAALLSSLIIAAFVLIVPRADAQGMRGGRVGMGAASPAFRPSIQSPRYTPPISAGAGRYAGRDPVYVGRPGPVYVDDVDPGRPRSERPPPRKQASAPPKRQPPRSQAAASPPPANIPLASERNYVPRQIVAEIDSALTLAQTDALARRLRLVRMETQDIPLIGARIGLFRITDDRSVETVAAQMRVEAGVVAVQPNYRYVLQDQSAKPALGSGDPSQYALAKMHLREAHQLSDGGNVTVAVIDSGIDGTHPELAGSVAGSFDALGSEDGPHAQAHAHGTGIAGAIVAHGRLLGSAPRARILAIRAFAMAKGGAESSSFTILRSLDHAAQNGAQVVNMSFAGPRDPLIGRGIDASASRGIVMIAASGNAGPTSPPLYPAASPSVIAVSATDANDALFAPSNRGSHIAVAAPGVDIFVPSPNGAYQIASGTSFAAAYVSGVAALMMARDPQLQPRDLRAVLMRTARDLGEAGRDDQFGAGAADALPAVSAVPGATISATTAPIMPAAARGDAQVTRTIDNAAPALTAESQNNRQN